jgi:Protein of unknown function (DUF2877)
VAPVRGPEPTCRPGAACTAARAPLAGAERPARVLAAFPSAVYLLLPGTPPPDVLALVAADGRRLPNAVVLEVPAAHGPFAAVRAGDAATVGSGRILLAGPAGGLLVEARRWWRPGTAGPATSPAGLWHAGARLSAALAAATPGTRPGGLPDAPDLADPFTRRSGARLATAAAELATAAQRLDVPGADRAARRVLGLGHGLTPEGDDLVSGFLVGLAQLAPPGGPLAAFQQAFGARTVAAAAQATTALSAALLAHAARGEAPPEVVAVLAALVATAPARTPPRGQPDPEPADDLVVALPALLAVGHTSGYRLAAGIHAAVQAVASHLPASPPGRLRAG